MIVSKHMSAPPITVSHDTDYKTAMGLMQKHRIRRIPVLDAHGALAGIVAERDLRQRLPVAVGGQCLDLLLQLAGLAVMALFSYLFLFLLVMLVLRFPAT